MTGASGPLFIVFEGIDGSGKSTQADMLYDHFLAENRPAVRLFEPTQGEWGRKIRSMLSGDEAPDAVEQLRLFIRDREDDVRKNVRPALDAGKIIIMDRYYYSNAAYQGAAGIDPFEIIKENIEMGFPGPDRVYLIDIEPETALERIERRNGSVKRDLFERQHFLAEVRDIYNSIADESFVTIDGTLPADRIFSCVLNDVAENFHL